jgi:hypothetical protein
MFSVDEDLDAAIGGVYPEKDFLTRRQLRERQTSSIPDGATDRVDGWRGKL